MILGKAVKAITNRMIRACIMDTKDTGTPVAICMLLAPVFKAPKNTPDRSVPSGFRLARRATAMAS